MTVQELAKQMDAVIIQRDAAKVAVEKLEKELMFANNSYSETVAHLNDLHKQYLAKMQDVLSYGGTKHVG
jgi:predicted  nucleic acid-binding Zn-ribbon protein